MLKKLLARKLNLTRSELADLCGVHAQTVTKWYEDGDLVIPAQYCPIIQMATNIPLHELNNRVFTDEWRKFNESN